MQLLEYRSVGAKNYSIKYCPSGQNNLPAAARILETLVKCKGISFVSLHNAEAVNEDVMRDFVYSLLRGQTRETYVRQWGIATDPRSRQVLSRLVGKIYSNQNVNKRVFLQFYTPDVTDTLPFGFDRNMLQGFLSLLEQRYGVAFVFDPPAERNTSPEGVLIYSSEEGETPLSTAPSSPSSN